MMLLIYTILYTLALFVIFPFEYFRKPQEQRSRWLHERLGIFAACIAETTPDKKVVWIHAVSVGEAAAAVSIVKKIKTVHPEVDIFISTVTDTGQKIATERLGHLARIIYVPFDLPGCISGTLAHVRPSLFIIMETEIWPNIIMMMKQRGIPVLLINGRISEKSFTGYMKAGYFIKKVLKDIAVFGMQDEEYARRIRLLGAAPESVIVTGNLKFDMQPASGIPEWTDMLAGITIIAGSTHKPEEDIVLDAYQKLLVANPGLNLIIAPRHPARFAEVAELLAQRKLRFIKRSEINGLSEEQKKGSSDGLVVLLDVIGELAALYGAADIAVMGGSFIEHGGQNPLEPAYWGKAIVCGPHMENFPFMYDFYSSNAAIRAEASSLSEDLNYLITSENKRLEIGRAARVLYGKNTGATERSMEIIGRYL
jgi:3-deoxy-D-manno-octulosonic-acid transferase